MSTAGSEAGVSARDPSVVENPPDRSTIAYRVGEFADFRRALLSALPGESALGGWRPVPGDLGLQMLEWWAYLADILTFYDERIANESYLRTAELPASVANLVALLGYRPRPAIAAIGALGAIRRAGRPREALAVPAGTRFASTATPGVPPQTFEASASGSFLGPSDVPAILAPDTALLSSAGAAGSGERSVLLAGHVSSVKGGDRLLLLERGWSGGNDNWAAVTVAHVAPEADPNGAANTRLTFEAVSFGPRRSPFRLRPILGERPVLEEGALLGGQFLTEAHSVEEERQRAPELGRARALRAPTDAEILAGTLGERPVSAAANVTLASGIEGVLHEPLLGGALAGILAGPPPQTPQAGDYRLVRLTQGAGLWTQQTSSETGTSAPEGQGSGALSLPLSAVARGISPGDVVLLDAGDGGIALGLVGECFEEMLAVPYPAPTEAKPAEIPVSHTVLTLQAPSADTSAALSFPDPGAVAVRHGLRDVGTPIPTPATTLTRLPASVSVPSGFSVPIGGPQALLEDASGAGVIVTVTANDDGTLQLSEPPDTPAALPLSAPLRLLVDLIPIARGTSVAAETLGVGDATLANQTFALKQAPLTYLASGDGHTSSLQIAVDGVIYMEVDSVYGQPADAKIFTVGETPAGTSRVRFGDGIEGARLPSGGLVVAAYRYGAGAASPPAGRLTTILKPQPNLGAVHNPVAVSGGADAEQPADIRSNAPASVLTFERAISASDYEVVAARAPGVSRARAQWSWDGLQQRSLVKVYVGDDAAAVAQAASALAGSEDPNRPVAVELATAIALTLSCTIVVAADRTSAAVIAAAEAAVSDPDSGLFSAARMAIGAPLYSSEVEAALSVAGVVAVRSLSLGPNELTAPRLSFRPGVFELLEPELEHAAGVVRVLPPLNLLRASNAVSPANPVAVLDPGEGSFFTLATSNITAVPDDA